MENDDACGVVKEKMERKVCAVEAEFLGLVNAEGRGRRRKK